MKENDIVLAVHGMSVITAPLEMIIDMLASGGDVMIDLARNVYGPTVAPSLPRVPTPRRNQR